MKPIHYLSMAAIMALFACCSNGKSAQNNTEEGTTTEVTKTKDNTPTDVHTFGMKGRVKEVRLSVADLLSANEEDSWLEDNKLEMTFDEDGRVTLDFYENVYEYDETGKFLKGVTDYAAIERDKEGRIVKYSQVKDEEDDAQFTYNIKYDEKGRMAEVNLLLWESTYTEKMSYTGDNPYFDKIVMKGDDQGDTYNAVTSYEYTKFDEQGNWTERTCTIESKTTDEEGNEIDSSTQKTRQTRVITYYE